MQHALGENLMSLNQGRSQGGVPQVHVHPPFKKKPNYFLCRIIRFYTNNPKCQYVYLSFYLIINDYQISLIKQIQSSGQVLIHSRGRGGGATGACAPPFGP